MKKVRKRKLGIFLLAMMNVAIILSLRGLPLMAKEGLSLIFYLCFALLFLLIPTALISAELGSGWPKEGGVFRWVFEAFGQRAGFTAIWLQWLQNVFWYPTLLAFGAGTLAYLFLAPELAENPLYNILVILVIYWGATAINLRGIRAAGWLSSTGVIIGTILPGILIIVLGLVWWGQGNPLQFEFTANTFFPDFTDFSKLSLLAGILLLFSGMEVNAVHILEVKDPVHSYPKAIFLSVGIIFSVFLLGSLSVAAVLPEEEISLTAGVMQAFVKFVNIYRLNWLVPLLGLFVAFGAIGGVAAWIVGPSKGMFATAKLGLIPPFLSRSNKEKIPVNILIVQGVIVSVLSFLFLITPTVSSAFFLLSDLAVMLYLIMYILLFAAAIRLRYSAPRKKRPYKVFGGNFGMWCVAGLGIVGALFAIFIGFFPPEQLKMGSPVFYVSFLVISLFISLIVPQVFLSMRKASWRKK